MTHYDTDIIAYNSVIIVTGFADELDLLMAAGPDSGSWPGRDHPGLVPN